jgi:fatty acid desaturase
MRVWLTRLLFLSLLAIAGATATSIAVAIVEATIRTGVPLPAIAFVGFLVLSIYAVVLWIIYLVLVDIMEFGG